MKLYDRKGKLYLQYSEYGKRVRKSTGLTYTKANVAYAYKNIIPKIEEKLNRGIDTRHVAHIEHFTDMVLDEAEEKKPNTYRLYKCAISKFFNFFDKNTPIEDITIRDIDSYTLYLRAEGFSASGIKTYLAPINQAFKEAIRQEYLGRNPVEYSKKPKKSEAERKKEKKRKKALTLLQVENMLQRATTEYLRTFLYFAFYTGMRIGEVLALTWDDVDMESLKISVNKTKRQDGGTNSPKNGRDRTVPILSPLLKHISSLERRSGNIIPQSYSSIANHFKKTTRLAGIEGGITPHSTRHTFISMLINAKKNPVLVQNLVGHNDLTMINTVYSHFLASESDVSELEDVLIG